MFLIRPQADIPIVEVSINDQLSAKEHFALGKALAPLRDDDTLIICSGQATHNLRATRKATDKIVDWAQGFQDWMDRVFASAEPQLSYRDKVAQLESWETAAPFVQLAHPTPDHFSPFIVAAGAGMDEAQPAAEKVIGGWAMGHMSFATYVWGLGAK